MFKTSSNNQTSIEPGSTIVVCTAIEVEKLESIESVPVQFRFPLISFEGVECERK
jgi:hypothetical protein